MTALATAVVCAVVAWWCIPAPATLVRSDRRRPTLPRIASAALAMAGLVAVGAVLGGLSGALWTLDGCVLAGTIARVVTGVVAARRRGRRSDEIAHAMQVVAGQLRVGSVPSVALASAARDCPCLQRPAATQAIGGDVAHALAEAGREPGREGLQSMSRAWELAERTGAPMASLAVQVSDQVREDHRTRRVVQAELAGPRATGRLLAALPLVGLLMGGIAGAHPLRFLLGTLGGQTCLFAGIVLACAGLSWTEWMARRAVEA